MPVPAGTVVVLWADKVLSVGLEVRAVCEHKPFLVLCRLSLVPSVSMECWCRVCALGSSRSSSVTLCARVPALCAFLPRLILVPLQTLSCGIAVGPLVAGNVGQEFWTGTRSSCFTV